ncbi:MAG: MFS transporter [Acidobacteria bacterium]|nr:MFS transporter [Acidobacteriota bacterium]
MKDGDASQIKQNGGEPRFFTKPLIIIFVTVLIDLIGFGIVIPVLPYYVEGTQFGATPLELGLLVASYSLMQFIFSPILGGTSDHYGRRPVLFFSLLGTSAGFFMVGFANSLWMIFAGRILDGITGGNISTAQAYIADVTTRKNRAKGMGLIGAAFGLGFILGPAIGGILSRWGAHVPFIFAGGMALCNAIGLYFFLPESLPKEKRSKHGVSANRFLQIFDSVKDGRFRTLSILYFLIITGFSIMTTSFALYTMERFGYDAEQNGYLFAYIGILSILMQGGIFGRLVHRVGEAPLVVAGSLLLAGSLFAVPYVGPQWGGLTGLLIGMACFGIGNSLASPALTSLASKAAPDHEQGKALGIMQSGASLARAIGPLIAGVLMNTAAGVVTDHSLQVTFWTASAIMFAAFLGSLLFAKNGRVVEAHAD